MGAGILVSFGVFQLEAQSSCSNVALNVSSDGQFLIGSSTGGSSYSFTLNGQTIASGPTQQLALFHYDNALADSVGLAPAPTAVGQWFGPGKFSNALGVATGGTVEYPAAGNLSFTSGTIEMWIAPQFAGTASVYSARDNSLLRYVAPNGQDQLTVSEAPSGVIYGGTVVGGNYAGAGGGSMTGWPEWQWHHVAFTYSTTAGRFRIYLDGALIDEADGTVPMPAPGGSFAVGGDPWGFNSAFMVDELRILNTEATPQQIQSDALRTGPFADNESYVALSGLAAGQVTYQVDGSSGAACGSTSFVVAPLTNVTPASGLLPTGSTSVPLSFSSSQATSCRYSVGSSPGWSSMQAFDNGPVTSHSGTISGLSSDPRVLNSVYIACDLNSAYVTELQYRSVATPSGSYPRIGSIWSGQYVYDTLPAQAEQIQLFLGAPFTASQATAIRSSNPGVLILPSINATETTNGVPVVPSSYYLRDTSGNLIEDWPGNYLLDLTNPAVVQFLANYAAQVVSQSNFAFDGIFFDNFKTTISTITNMYGQPVQVDTNSDGVPDDPATLDAAWSAGVYQEIALFRQLLPNAYASGHIGALPPAPSMLSAFNGDSFAFPAVDVREGTVAFNSLLGAYQTWFLGGESPVIAMVQSSPPNQIAYGYGFTPESVMLPSTQQFAQTFYPNMRFGLATALMNNGFSTYDFGDTGAPVSWWYDEYNFNLGTPLGPAVQIGQSAASNMLLNPGFESGLTNWTLSQTAPASATMVTDTAIVAQGNISAHVNVATAGTAAWQTSFEQDNVPMTAGVSYQLQFWARSDVPRNITLNSQGGAPAYTPYGLYSVIAINTNWTLYTVSFVSTATAGDCRIEFLIGDQTGNVWIDGVVLTLAPTSVYRRDYTNGSVLLNGTTTPQTISMGSGFQRFSGTQAPMYQYIIDDSSASFSASGAWSTVTYSTGYSTSGGGEVPNGPYYNAWNGELQQLSSGSGTATWNLNIPADGTYTIQAWLPAAPAASTWAQNAVYKIVAGGSVIDTVTLNQTSASAGDQWYTLATLNLTAASNPQVVLSNGGSGVLAADAIYVTSAALYNNGAPASSVTLAAMDGILLQRQTPLPAAPGALASVLSTATWQGAIAPSTLVSLTGYGFGSSILNFASAMAGNQLPMSLGGISATIDGLPAAVYSVSPTQVLVISPDDTTVGMVPVQLTVNGATYTSTVTLQKLAPALFPTVSGGISYGQATHSSGAAVSVSAPANPGETITLMATGLGTTNPATPSSETVSGWAPVTLPVTVTIGGVAAQVQSAAKVSPGCYAIVVTVPSSAGAGNQTVQVGISGFASPAGVFLPIA